MILKAALLMHEEQDTLKELKSLLKHAELKAKTLVFPVKGQNLLNREQSPGPEISRRLEKIKKAWLQSECSLSKEECLSLGVE